MSGKVVVNRSMSLDGFIAGPGDAMDWIFDFMAPDAAWLTEIASATGAMLVGRTHLRPHPPAAGPAGPGCHLPQR